MKLSLKNWLFLNNSLRLLLNRRLQWLPVFFFFTLSKGQVVNYVNNPSFENNFKTGFDACYFWGPIDTSRASYYLFSTSPNIANAPYCSTGFQFPRTGNNFILSQFYCTGNSCTPNTSREYPRNRLKQKLKPNTSYCAKYYVVNTNNNKIAIDKYGIFFSNSLLDTIKYCNTELTYLSPQVENSTGIITDTLNWIPVSGTFVAIGDEKYMVLGNFQSNVNTNTLLLNSPLPSMSNDVYIDDVSLIELDLNAYAGPDVNFIPGNIFYIGRPPDVGINEACTWFALPNMTNTLAISAGIWVSPANTTTYVVRQEICGVVKWDTVVAYKSAVGLEELKIKSEQFKVFPNPASNELFVSFGMEGLDKEFTKAEILNNLGQIVWEIDLNFIDKKVGIDLTGFPAGVYHLSLKGMDSQTVSKKFVVSQSN